VYIILVVVVLGQESSAGCQSTQEEVVFVLISKCLEHNVWL